MYTCKIECKKNEAKITFSDFHYLIENEKKLNIINSVLILGFQKTENLKPEKNPSFPQKPKGDREFTEIKFEYLIEVLPCY